MNPELAVLPLRVAEIFSDTVELVAEVVMPNVADVCPASTVTVAGTWATALLVESATTAPPVGAGPVRVTVPVEVAPPVTELGELVTK